MKAAFHKHEVTFLPPRRKGGGDGEATLGVEVLGAAARERLEADAGARTALAAEPLEPPRSSCDPTPRFRHCGPTIVRPTRSTGPRISPSARATGRPAARTTTANGLMGRTDSPWMPREYCDHCSSAQAAMAGSARSTTEISSSRLPRAAMAGPASAASTSGCQRCPAVCSSRQTRSKQYSAR